MSIHPTLPIRSMLPEIIGVISSFIGEIGGIEVLKTLSCLSRATRDAVLPHLFSSLRLTQITWLELLEIDRELNTAKKARRERIKSCVKAVRLVDLPGNQTSSIIDSVLVVESTFPCLLPNAKHLRISLDHLRQIQLLRSVNFFSLSRNATHIFRAIWHLMTPTEISVERSIDVRMESEAPSRSIAHDAVAFIPAEEALYALCAEWHIKGLVWYIDEHLPIPRIPGAHHFIHFEGAGIDLNDRWQKIAAVVPAHPPESHSVWTFVGAGHGLDPDKADEARWQWGLEVEVAYDLTNEVEMHWELAPQEVDV